MTEVIDATLTEAATGLEVRLLPTPAMLPSSQQVRERSWDLLAGGTVRQPRSGGPTPRAITLNVWFPGGQDYGEPWAPEESWRPPRDLLDQLRAWMHAGAELRLLVTETDLDVNVWIASLADRWGELDRLYVDLELVELRALWVEVVSQSEAQQQAAETAALTAGSGLALRARSEMAARLRRAGEPPAPVPDTWIVRAGQTLPIIAAMAYGDSSRWTEIRDANADRLAGLDLDDLPTGLQLRVPGGQGTSTVQPRQRGAPVAI